jgi:hypothetical protein
MSFCSCWCRLLHRLDRAPPRLVPSLIWFLDRLGFLGLVWLDSARQYYVGLLCQPVPVESARSASGSVNFFCSCHFNSTLPPSPDAAALSHSPSPWVLLQLLQTLSQSCNVRCLSMAPTIVTGFLACISTCVDFDFGTFSRVSFPAHRLLRRLLILCSQRRLPLLRRRSFLLIMMIVWPLTSRSFTRTGLGLMMMLMLARF